MLDKTVNTENTMVIAMSTTFYPRDDPPTNLTIITSDSVFFSVVTILSTYDFFAQSP